LIFGFEFLGLFRISSFGFWILFLNDGRLAAINLNASQRMKNFDYLEPTTVAEACALLKQYGGEAKIFAGGAHLTILMKQGLYQPKVLVNIKRIPELKGIHLDPAKGLIIGALVTHHEIETSALVKEKLSVLAESEKEVANIRVRNMGTVGGNLASGEPLTDLAQIFISVDGKAKIVGVKGNRTIPLEELFVDFYQTSLAEDEILSQVVIPLLPPHSGVEYIRFSSSSVVDKPSAGVAVRISLEPKNELCQLVRIVLGCVGATPVRARKAEALLTEKKVTLELAREAGALASQECSPIADLRGSEKYKRAIVGTLVKRAASKAYERALGNKAGEME
jgi:aerobic carbon-monoxide dehydrogenase medium subunit